MFNTLRSLIKGSGRDESGDGVAVAAPFSGLRLGAQVELDLAKVGLFEDELLMDIDTSNVNFKVEAHGVIDLGQSVSIERFYTDTDAYIRVACNGEKISTNVTDIWFLAYDYSGDLTNESDINNAVSKISADQFEYRGKVFTKVFSAEFDELVTNTKNERYSILNQQGVFERETENGLREILVMTLEQDQEDEVTESIALGLSIEITNIHALG